CDVSVFNWSELSALRNGLTRQAPREAHVARRRLPFTLDMVNYVYDTYWTDPLLQQRVYSVAVILGFCCLLRPSEYTVGKDNTHVLRASALEFEYTHGQATLFVGAHLAHAVPWSAIRLVRIYMSSAKNFRVGRALWFSTGTSIASLNLVHVLYQWVCATRPASTDFLLSWPIPSPFTPRGELQYVDFVKVVKHAATTFGFAPTLFGPHALRVGGAAVLRAAGASDGEILLMGRWKSLPACLGYQEVTTYTHDRMLRLLLRPGTYTARDIRLQYRVPALHNAIPLPCNTPLSDNEEGV
ncbi:hypothetical protein B484DRAFT_460888, partial [Ochromonadaceae sp. CCMP2298]